MSVIIRPYSAHDAPMWDEFCNGALQSTLLHTRRFLSYHGERFLDCSLVIEEDGKCLGLYPAAVSPRNGTLVVSHPGITYGGVIHQGGLRGERMVDALSKVGLHYRALGYERLIYKAVPIFYHRAPAQDDLYALFRLGYQRLRCDLSSTIDLGHRLPVSERRRRSLKKANKAGVNIVEGIQYLAPLWSVLAGNLESKHGVEPVHTLSEIMMLAGRFPIEIRCVCAQLNNEVVAGVVLFITASAYHAQYIASTDTGYKVSALDMVFDQIIQTAIQEKKRWFDFGISNENEGKCLNDGLYRFKSEFGGGGVAHEFYELNLISGIENEPN